MSQPHARQQTLEAPLVRRTRSFTLANEDAVQTLVPEAPLVRRLRSGSRDRSGSPSHREVMLFWDYENAPLPGSRSVVGADACARRLCDHARRFGRLVEVRLYSDSCKASTLPTRHRDMLQQRGVTLIDCPTNDKKEAIDKKILVDCCCWAVAAHHRVVVLVSSDGDFAYMFSRLRSVGVWTCAAASQRMSERACTHCTSESMRNAACGCLCQPCDHASLNVAHDMPSGEHQELILVPASLSDRVAPRVDWCFLCAARRERRCNNVGIVGRMQQRAVTLWREAQA